MTNKLLATFILIYLAGFFIAAVQSLLKCMQLIHFRDNGGMDLLKGNSFMKSYLILRVIAWPYYLFVLSNPLVLISQCFFRHYGNDGQWYFGTKGLKNFLNDVLKGKNRYRGCDAQKVCFAVDKAALAYQDYCRSMGKEYAAVYAQIIYAKFKGKYLLHVIYSDDLGCMSISSVTRFDLDECERLNAYTIKQKLDAIHPEKAADIVRKLS